MFVSWVVILLFVQVFSRCCQKPFLDQPALVFCKKWPTCMLDKEVCANVLLARLSALGRAEKVVTAIIMEGKVNWVVMGACRLLKHEDGSIVVHHIDGSHVLGSIIRALYQCVRQGATLNVFNLTRIQSSHIVLYCFFSQWSACGTNV